MRICVSLAEKTTKATIDGMARLSRQADLFEVRGDLVEDLALAAILEARCRPLLLTCLPRSEGGLWPDDDPDRRLRLLEATERGYDFVDVNLQSGFHDIMSAKAGRGLVVSFHDLAGIPHDLDTLYRRMAATGADIVKIAGTPRSLADVGRLMALAGRVAEGDGPPLIPIAMGPLGAVTRILGGRDRVPFMFASAQTGAEAAPGQISIALMADLYRVREINPRTRAYGVLGRNVRTNPALVVHNRCFRALGVDSVCVPLEAEALPPFLAALPGIRLSGFSVTGSYESEILDHLDEVDGAARRSGRVDTVIVEDGRLRGIATHPDSSRIVNGDPEAFLAQAARQVETWTGRPATRDVMREAFAAMSRDSGRAENGR
ncbi:MAG: type I 3-dehydroquinate dehydratase [Vicinamibacteria bacterium]|nr:type I 3-dehydroquinate dehydratase [Vicinamibacteria bacterium]